MTGIRGGEHVRLRHKFKCGFLESNYYLPVRYAPLEIEVTLVSGQLHQLFNQFQRQQQQHREETERVITSQNVTPAHNGS